MGYDGYVHCDVSALRREVRYLATLRLPDGKGLLSSDGNRRWRANFAYRCEAPFERTKVGRSMVYRSGGMPDPVILTSEYPCRKCGGCNVRKRNQWMMRSRDEFYASARTWMATFTMSPVEHAALDARAYRRWKGGHVPGDPRAPTSEELLHLRMRVFTQLVCKWLRSVCGGRKGTAARRSYLLVGEVHDGPRTSGFMRGRPHVHALFHEKELGVMFEDTDCEWVTNPVTQLLQYRVKDEAPARLKWPMGFTKFVLCTDECAAVYVTKYLDLAMDARVKASRGYGASNNEVDNLHSSFLTVVPNSQSLDIRHPLREEEERIDAE